MHHFSHIPAIHSLLFIIQVHLQTVYAFSNTNSDLFATAFMPVIKSQGTAEQVEKWYNASKRHAIIGCYAQTELR